jgi:hypothetical protein
MISAGREVVVGGWDSFTRENGTTTSGRIDGERCGEAEVKHRSCRHINSPNRQLDVGCHAR